MIEINQLKVKFSHINTRLERHGEEEVVAKDLKFVGSTTNDLLKLLDPDLYAYLYEANGQAGELDLDEQRLPDLVMPDFVKANAPFKLGYEGQGYKVTMHTGLDATTDQVLSSCKFNNIKYTPKSDGIVDFEFRVQLSKEDNDTSVLDDLLSDTFEISLAPPELVDFEDL